jgi:hypothetical protein
MAGVFTDTRYSVSSITPSSLHYKEVVKATGVVSREIYVPPRLPLTYLNPTVFVGDGQGSIGGKMLGVSPQVVLDSVTSFRSGGKWDLLKSDPSTIGPTLLDEAKSSQGDNGHTFNSVKHRLISNDGSRVLHLSGVYPTITAEYNGPVGVYRLGNSTIISGGKVSGGLMLFPTVPDVSVVYGTKAIANSLPTSPNVNLLTDIFELRDGLPRFPGMSIGTAKNRSELLKKSSDEYLNYVFGIVPAVSDLSKFINSISTYSKSVSQMLVDSDKIVRRRYTFPAIRSTSITTGTTGMSDFQAVPQPNTKNSFSLPTGMLDSGTKTLEVSDNFIDKIWFSGAFRYHINSDDSVIGRMTRMSDLVDKLVGLKLTPDKVYQAIPWTWLVDWFVDITDLFRNANFINQYNGLLQYGYLMCDSTYTRVYTVKGVTFRDYQSSTVKYGPWDLSTTLVTTRKQRIRATPFGFGLNPSSFSDSQWAILGALGLSRGPKTLW